jgi:hypothetical protein
VARDLRAIKVKITYGKVIENGKEVLRHIYPNFNLISSANREDMDWSSYITKVKANNWHYSFEGFGEGADPDTWYGMLLVPQAFADEAVTMFPGEVSYMATEAEVEDFYNNDAHVKEPENDEDETVLRSIAAKRQIGLKQTAQDIAALDPDDPAYGIRRNPRKNWKRFKTHANINLV